MRAAIRRLPSPVPPLPSPPLPPAEVESAQGVDPPAGNELEIVDNTDQFGKIISKYRYIRDKNGTKHINSYSIYYYGEHSGLYNVTDYDSLNRITAYNLIMYDDQEKRIKIKKIDADDNLMYVE